MRAVVFKDKRVSIEERPRPKPSPGLALLKPLVAGICNTDIELFEGYYGFSGVPGHEFVARVVEAEVRPRLVGRRVVADINIGCDECPRCRQGDPRHCAKRKVLGIKGADGCFADYCLAPVTNLRVVDDSIDDRAAVFAEPLAAALEIGQQVHITARDRVLVLGDGKLGLLAALGLRTLCPSLVLAGKHEDKLAIASAQGVETVLTGDLLPEAAGFDVVVEATGRPEGLNRALELVRPEGTVVVKTTSHSPVRLDFSRAVVNEITLVGSRCGDMSLALTYLREQWLDPTPLIEAELPLERFEEAFALAMTPGAKKVLVRM